MKRIKFSKNFRNPYLVISIITLLAVVVMAFALTTIDDFFMPGSQPLQSGNLEHPQKCDNCHGGYDLAVEPAHNWRGSMMSQAMRDPLFLASLAIANQDAPDAGDLCIRCHSPAGWLEGRSIPTDGSALNNNDMEGVQCDFCHKLVKPAEMVNGNFVNPYPGDPDYTADTWPDDESYLTSIMPNVPPQDGNGMYVVDNSNSKRGPFVDANAKHQMEYSPFHSESAICGTCHDVSNPAFDEHFIGIDDEGNPYDYYLPNSFGTQAISFETDLLFPVERTYSEWLNSSYNTADGVLAPQFGGNKEYVSTCQDCHMRDVTGYGCNKKGVPLRDDLPLHDMTGGNTFVPGLVAQLFPDDVDIDAINDGIERARYMLKNAATMNVSYTVDDAFNYIVDVEVINETGHKLPSGYPEGRRIWINVEAYQGSVVVWESGAYNLETAVLSEDDQIKVYEIKPGLSQELIDALENPPGLVEGPSFHFAINNRIFFDNRIPPRGFTNANFELIQSPVIPKYKEDGSLRYADGQYSDVTTYSIPAGGQLSKIVATLYYQTTTKEFVEFLRDENYTNDAGNLMYSLWESNGKSTPELMEQVEILLTQPPVADFDASPESGDGPLTVTFTDESSNNPTSWSWSFGDGNTSTEQNPVHVYTGFGTFQVTLVATNGFGSSAPYQSEIVVTDPNQPVIYVQDMTVGRVGFNGNRWAGSCEVLVWDNNGNPVSGAIVSSTYNGPNSGSNSGVTGADGIATLQSKAIKNPNGEWCFTVTDVSMNGMVYDPILNNISDACESTTKDMDVEQEDGGSISIDQVFPNPLTESSTIAFTLQKDAYVQVEVFNQFGQKVGTLLQANRETGSYQVEWRAGHLPAGIYFVRISAAGEVKTYKLLKNN